MRDLFPQILNSSTFQGRRHVELEKRRLEDDVFKQLITVHQETVESYLEDVISECIDQSSNIEAREKVREYADKINSVVDEIEKRYESGK